MTSKNGCQGDYSCPSFLDALDEPREETLATQAILSSKAAFPIAFLAAVNHNYDWMQRTLKQRNTQNGSKSSNHKSEP